jgi:hypothetical protein
MIRRFQARGNDAWWYVLADLALSFLPRLSPRQCAAKPGIILMAILAARSSAGAADHVDGNLIVFNDNGAWSWYQDERAIVDAKAGKLLVSSVAASMPSINGPRDGNVDLVTFDLASGATTRFVLGKIQEDDHNVAAI